MRNSTPSKHHCSPPSIKAQHRFAKKKPRAIRRTRIDLRCGCSYYFHVNCRNYGFTHRGEHHCCSAGEWRLYLGRNKSPVFQDNATPERTPGQQREENPDPHNVQPSAEESVGDAQVFPGLDDIPSMDSQLWADLLNF
ncbi:transcriptional activator protein [Rhynchosia yellow mosaic virus]|uniref:Transcriptional activator protein n=1 Tax=Rhynchosia yellow mosaic virus TaxID=529680 RepID=C7TPF8_9GEMI|nr:transcriptional activator protein [Rhynchosia yellow mosaic virus]CAQ53914.1 transcriptional activator protein [Rhynchosia yellow mosaic virus]CAR64501.1 transcription activator protein [Rhynchosia yellow mosaic virus]